MKQNQAHIPKDPRMCGGVKKRVTRDEGSVEATSHHIGLWSVQSSVKFQFTEVGVIMSYILRAFGPTKNLIFSHFPFRKSAAFFFNAGPRLSQSRELSVSRDARRAQRCLTSNTSNRSSKSTQIFQKKCAV